MALLLSYFISASIPVRWEIEPPEVVDKWILGGMQSGDRVKR